MAALRESDGILAADLRDAGLNDLAARAESGEWNDFFGIHDMPQHHLIQTLMDEPSLPDAVRSQLIQNVKDGHYDATPAECHEWIATRQAPRVRKEGSS